MIPRRDVQVTGKIARRDGVHLNPLPGQPISQVPAQLDDTRLGHPVGMVEHRVDLAAAVDRGDVDHLGRGLGRGPHPQQRQELQDHEVDALDVEIRHRVPALLGDVFQLGVAVADAGVVDQDVQGRLAFGVGPHQRLDAGDRTHVGNQVLTGADCRQLVPFLLQCVLPARGQIDLGSEVDKAFRDHRPDPDRAAGNQRGLARERKQILHRRSSAAPHSSRCRPDVHPPRRRRFT